jgi:hypothetical protein
MGWLTNPFGAFDIDCECTCCRPRRVRPGSAAFASDKGAAAEVQADNDDQGDEHADGIGGWG